MNQEHPDQYREGNQVEINEGSVRERLDVLFDKATEQRAHLPETARIKELREVVVRTALEIYGSDTPEDVTSITLRLKEQYGEIVAADIVALARGLEKEYRMNG